MTSEQLKRAIKKSGTTQTEIAHKLNTTQQNFNNKVKRMSFSDDELNQIAEMLHAKYLSCFVFEDGTQI